MLGLDNRTLTCDVFLIQVKGRIAFIKRQYLNSIIDEPKYYKKLDNIRIMLDELYISGVIDDTIRD